MEAARFAGGVIVVWLAKKKVSFHVLDVCIGNESRFPQISFPFPVFLLKNVTFALFAAQNLTGASHFKAFGYGRSGF
jgi:hypothetical protein